tara:strand:+ start:1853 stop:2326 length:474 start_codon:yes stop_codon:yes gene_type:complete
MEKKKQEKKGKISDKQKIVEFTDTLQRLQAEFENYKKRVDKEKVHFLEYSKAELIAKLLPIIDTFELALQNSQDNKEFAKGIEMIFGQLYSLLEQEGLRKIEVNGKFDPFKHEVLMKEGSDKEEDTILEELQKGYMLKDKVLRHSKVKVSEKVDQKS